MIRGFVGSQQESCTWEERGFATDGKEPAGRLGRSTVLRAGL